MLDSILFDLEKHVGIKAVRDLPEMKGYILLPVEETIDIWVKEVDPGFFFHAKVAPLFFPKDREAYTIYLMKANFLGQGTGGGSLAIDPDEKFLTLSLRIPYEVNYKTFRDRLEDFTNYLAYWKSRVREEEAKT